MAIFGDLLGRRSKSDWETLVLLRHSPFSQRISISFSYLTVISACWYFVALWLATRYGGDQPMVWVIDAREAETVLHML